MLPLNRKRLRVMTGAFCRKVVFMSRYARHTAVSFLEEVGTAARDEILARSVVLYPAVSVRRGAHEYGERGPLNLVFVGNEFIRKGGVSVWQVFNRLSRDHDIRLTLISNFKMPPEFRRKTLPGYPDYSVYQDRLDELLATRTEHVRILHDVSREEVLTKHLPEADIFLAPTFSDSFGIATLEAMAEGLPIVATNINAIPEAIEDGTEGLLIDGNLGEHPLIEGALHMKYSWRQLKEHPAAYLEHVNQQLEDKLVRLIGDSRLRETLGVNARIRFERTFSLAVRNENYERVYRDAAG
jgi:glycosyltransferase involved in cell wall biosynthesis